MWSLNSSSYIILFIYFAYECFAYGFNNICWKGLPSSTELLLQIHQNQIHIVSLFCSIDLYIYSSVKTTVLATVPA